MRTVYSKLAALLFFATFVLLLVLPMRSGLEDHLYADVHSLSLRMGDTREITYELDADYAQRVTFTSLDESVATVTESGRVTAMNPGSTDIHIKAEGGARTTVHVEVVGTPTTRVTLNTGYVGMEKGEVTGLTASFNEGAEDTRLEWLSDDPEIARVDSIGRVTAVRGGRTKVRAVTPNGLSAETEVFVHVPGDAVRITPEALTVGTGASLKMGTSYFPDDTTDEPYSWSSSDSQILSVDGDGTVHAMGVGTVVLSVFTREGLSASSVVHVERSAESFSLSPSAVTIERGETLDLETRFLNADGTPNEDVRGHYIQWLSSDPEVATVEDGHVIALKSGSTRITATADGMTAECDLQVQVLVHMVTLDKTEVYMLKQGTENPIQLNAAISPEDPDDPTISFSTSNDLVANVDANGLVTMTGGYGTAIITARAASGAEARFIVNIVTEIPDFSDNPNAVVLDASGHVLDTPAGDDAPEPSVTEEMAVDAPESTEAPQDGVTE